MKFFKISALLMLIMAFKCDDDDGVGVCSDTDIHVRSLESVYGCDDVPFVFDISQIEMFKIISSQEGFDEIVAGDCRPQIDFETYDLILGKQQLPNGIDVRRHTAIQDCETGALALTVTFTLNDTTQMPLVTYQILVPKLINPQATTVDVRID